MPVQEIDSSMGEELRDFMVATKICGGAKENGSALPPPDARGRGLWVAAGTKEKLQGFSKD